MTIKELIRMLETFSPNSEIKIANGLLECEDEIIELD